MKSIFVEKKLLTEIIERLYPDNRLIMKIGVATGLRISDILQLHIGDIRNNKPIRLNEIKTGKSKTIHIPVKLRNEILSCRNYTSDGYLAFQGRIDRNKPRTRQAVWHDIQRVLKEMGIESTQHCSPHSARKYYAVDVYRRTKDLKKVQEALNHESINTTIIYALSDILK